MRTLLSALLLSLGLACSARAQPPDSCLVLAGPQYHPAFGERNSDSVLYDICDASAPMERRIYARRWFGFQFDHHVIDLPPVSSDSIIEVGPEAVGEQFKVLRDTLLSLQLRYGPFLLHKVYSDSVDSNRLESRVFRARFVNLVNTSAVVSDFNRAPGVTRFAFLSFPAAFAVVSSETRDSDGDGVRLFPTVTDRTVCVIDTLARGQGAVPYRVMDCIGRIAGAGTVSWTPPASTPHCIDVSSLASGQYFFAYKGHLYRFNIRR